MKELGYCFLRPVVSLASRDGVYRDLIIRERTSHGRSHMSPVSSGARAVHLEPAFWHQQFNARHHSCPSWLAVAENAYRWQALTHISWLIPIFCAVQCILLATFATKKPSFCCLNVAARGGLAVLATCRFLRAPLELTVCRTSVGTT